MLRIYISLPAGRWRTAVYGEFLLCQYLYTANLIASDVLVIKKLVKTQLWWPSISHIIIILVARPGFARVDIGI